MRTGKPRPAKILDLEPDPNDPTMVKSIVVAAVGVQPISPFAFRCPLCGQVHTVRETGCKSTQLYVKDHHGKKRKLSLRWTFMVQLQSDRNNAGDLSEWLHSLGYEWPSSRNIPEQPHP